MGIEMEKAAQLPDPMVRNRQYYRQAYGKIVKIAEVHPNPDYRIQVGSDVAEYINEERQKCQNPDLQFLSSAIIERFDIMEAGFFVECYDAEFQEAWEESDRTGGFMIKVRPEIHNYFLARDRMIEEQGPPKTCMRYEDYFKSGKDDAAPADAG